MQVLINGKVSGFFERSNPRNLPLPNIFSDVGPNEEVSHCSPFIVSCPSGAEVTNAAFRYCSCVAVDWCRLALSIFYLAFNMSAKVWCRHVDWEM